uniref:beta-N-acetylhexosaminidase n=1 Tax=Neogobius melanostomus TaxID=47308 RepID=A0A8C6SEV1_9GOBI
MSPPWPEGKKLVHLDLKGAPPRIEYLLKLIGVFAELGADGLLVEYEDMFPYEGELKVLQASPHSAYSREEVLSIQEAAVAAGMEVIPLIQTFGHMEFVLKHDALSALREVPHCLGTLSPHGERPLQLVTEMVRQVVELHPGITTLHIGADEVYLLGEGEQSRKWLESHDGGVAQLFLSHVTRVAQAVKTAWPQLSILMWDDMMRDMSEDTLRDSGLVGLVQPMLWDYNPHLDVDKTVSLLEKYSRAGLAEVWAASSFKGSSSVHTSVSCSQRHVDNTVQWLRVAEAASAGVHIRGVALTGWQRYDHLSVLCELLPVALPSLASCLQTLVDGKFDAETQSRVTLKLGISSVEVETMEKYQDCVFSYRVSKDTAMFPGRLLAELIVDLNSFLNLEDVRYFEQNMFLRGWFSPYQRRTKMVNPLIVLQIQNQATAKNIHRVRQHSPWSHINMRAEGDKKYVSLTKDYAHIIHLIK